MNPSKKIPKLRKIGFLAGWKCRWIMQNSQFQGLALRNFSENFDENFSEAISRTIEIVETTMAFYLLYFQRRSTCPDCSDMSS